MTSRHELSARLRTALDRHGPEPAVIAPGWQSDYQTLREQASELAGQLAGAEGGMVAAVAADRPAAVTATLAVFLSECVLMHVDSRQPVASQAELLKSVGPDVIIATASALPALAAATWPDLGRAAPFVTCGQHVVAFRPDGTDTARWQRSPLLGDPADASYLCVTSGSTGTPKPIVGSATGLLDFIDWELGLVPPASRVSQLTFPRFDAYLRDVLVPLLGGGAICLPPRWEVPLGHDLQSWLSAQAVDVLHTVPSVVRSVEPHLVEASGHLLSAILIAGDRLYGSDVRAWLKHSPGTRIFNLYGPTETTMIKLAFEVPGDADDGPLPIGKPIGRSQAIVVDSGDVPCAPGRVGDIVLRTPFQPLGYYGPDPALGGFTPNPLNPASGGTVFRTGDLGRLRHDGVFEFAGRRDDQVKIRGVRLRLGDVESKIRELPGVTDAVVVAAAAGDNEQELVVVYTGPSSARGLQKQWQSVLLAESRPARAVRVAELPRTANGKADRVSASALATACRHEHGSEQADANLDPAMAPMRSIWAEVLGHDEISARDDFFDVGGNSLSAVRLLARISKEYGQSIGLGEFFEHPTLAAVLEQIARRAAPSSAVRLSALANGPAVYLAHPAGGFVASYSEIAAALDGRCAVIGLQPAGLTDDGPPDMTVEAMAERYLADLGDALTTAPYCLAGWSAGGLVAFEMARQLAAAGRSPASIVLIDSAPPGHYDEADDDIAVLAEIASGMDGKYHAGELRGLGDAEQLALIGGLAEKAFGGARPTAAEVRRYRDLYRAHLLARRRYRATRADVAITLIQPEREPVRSGGAAELAWKELAGLGLDRQVVPGEHRTMVTGPGAAAIATVIADLVLGSQ